MKTFKEFLRESDDALTLADIIKRDCQPFLREAKGAGFLMRGIKNFETPFTNVISAIDEKENKLSWGTLNKVVDRKPRHTPDKEHTVFNAWFEKEFGWKARSDGLFTFGDLGTNTTALSYYGDRHLIFPIGDFKYVWSPIVGDLYAEYPGDLTDHDKWLGAQGYTDKNLNKAIGLGHTEIMIKAEKFYAIRAIHVDDIDLLKRAVASTRHSLWHSLDNSMKQAHK